MVAYRVFYKQAVHVLSGVLVLSNICMISLGIAAMHVTFDLWLDVLVEGLIAGTTALNLLFIVIKWSSLNWKRNALANKIHDCFSRYLAFACGTILLNLLATAVNVFIVDWINPLHYIADGLATAFFIATHLFAIAGGYLAFVTSRMGTERGCEDHGNVPVWRFDCPITDDPILPRNRRLNIPAIFKATGIGAMLLLLAIAVYGPFIFLTAGPSIEYWMAGNLSIFMTFLIVLVTFLLARLVPRTKRPLHRSILVIIIATTSTIAAINTIPFFTSTTSVASIKQQFDSAFGSLWESRIPASVSNHFRDRPVALKDIILSIPIPEVDERFDVPYMQHKGKILKFDWYGPAGISTTSKRLPVVIALHPGSWKRFDKGWSNVVPTSRYIADQGYIVVDAQYGLHNDSAGAFTLKDMIMEIGNLTWLLETNAGEYHADLSRTYFLGRSAGGHLALVAGLAYNSSYFAGNFSSLVHCHGIIAFYPAADLRRLMGSADNEKLFGVPMADFWHFNPVNLTSSSSPPVLVYHGTTDSVIPIAHSEYLKHQLLASGRIGILGTFSGAEHMFDLFYNNFYNQVCIYFLERFLAITAT